MKYTSSKLEIISIILSLCLKQIYSYKLLNCYSSLPSSFYKDNTNEYQSSSLCYSTCSGKGYSYFALFDHNTCYCGSTSPGGLPISTSCNTYCYGYDREMCGGTSAYSIYSVDDAESVSNQEFSGSPSASSRTGSTASTSGTEKTSVSALAVGSSDSQIVIANGKSTSNQQQITRNSETGSGTEAVVATSVVYSTQLQTQGGSTIFVTNTITKSTGVLPIGSSVSNNNKSSSSNSKKKVNVGAIVGGSVGGVCGALVLLSALLFGLRYYNKKREEDRMEKEYQEAIKPVEYVPVDILSSSSHSYSFDGGNMNGKLNDSLGNVGSDNLKGNNTNINNLTVMSNTGNNNNNNNGLLSNPFDDSRRISTGSIISSDPDQNKPTKLTIVNPDE